MTEHIHAAFRRRGLTACTLVLATMLISAPSAQAATVNRLCNVAVEFYRTLWPTSKLIAALKAHPYRPKVIVMTGRPGSGKGTVSDPLVEQLNYRAISTGDLLREITAEQPSADGIAMLAKIAEQGQVDLGEIRATMAKGGLISDEIMVALLRAMLETIDPSKDLILDGIPRTKEQIPLLKAMLKELGRDLEIVLNNDVPEKVARQRLQKRAQEQNRADDASIETINRRFVNYESQTQPAIDALTQDGLVENVDATGTPDRTFRRALLRLLAAADRRQLEARSSKP